MIRFGFCAIWAVVLLFLLLLPGVLFCRNCSCVSCLAHNSLAHAWASLLTFVMEMIDWGNSLHVLHLLSLSWPGTMVSSCRCQPDLLLCCLIPFNWHRSQWKSVRCVLSVEWLCWSPVEAWTSDIFWHVSFEAKHQAHVAIAVKLDWEKQGLHFHFHFFMLMLIHVRSTIFSSCEKGWWLVPVLIDG